MDIDHKTSVDFTGYGEVKIIQNDSPQKPRSPFLKITGANPNSLDDSGLLSSDR